MPEETPASSPDPNAPDAADQCATCAHQRWRHKQVDGQQVCTEYVDCACQGHFVEISPATHMARFVMASQKFAGSIVAVRAAMTDAMRSFHELHTAMQSAGMLDEEPHLCDGCDRTDHPVTASPDGRALLCPDCQARLAAQEEPARTPALQQLATWHAPDCDKQCGGTCTHGAAEIIANAVGVPVEAITGPSPDGLPDHWRDAAPPIDTTTLPACPLDGQPLLQTYAAANQPTLYRHADGTIHPDRTAEIVASAVGAPVETVTESSPDDLGFPSHWRNPAVPTGQHVPTDLEVTAHIPPYTEYIPQRGPIEYPRSEELQAAAHVGNSCATCWPRPCDPTRSECRRHASGTDNPT